MNGSFHIPSECFPIHHTSCLLWFELEGHYNLPQVYCPLLAITETGTVLYPDPDYFITKSALYYLN